MSRPQRTTGNVFADLGFSPEETRHLKVRSTLMMALERIIKARGLTQQQAATLFGVAQPRISDLMCGKIDRFSSDMLIDMLTTAGAEVRVQVRPTRPPATAATRPPSAPTRDSSDRVSRSGRSSGSPRPSPAPRGRSRPASPRPRRSC
ncbi:MAG: XRE family transcriptional regulator [Gemmatimonadetes bacterium]|nr:XRE family transcriptional regulator [Gemmatimonadota bacterium]